MNFIRRTFREAMKTPGFSLLYMGGVAFTIAFTLVYGFILYGQLGPVYPEYDRANTYYIPQIMCKSENMTLQNSLGKPFIDEFLRDSLKSVEKATAIIKYNWGYPMVQTDGKGPEFHVEKRLTEPSFFDFYKYEFVAGRPFSQEEFDAKERVVVISDKVAKRLYGKAEDAIDGKISIDHTKYRITGVFREGSALSPDSYAEVFMPYNYSPSSSRGGNWYDKYVGGLTAVLKVKPGQQELLKKELREICQRINSVDTTAAKFYIPLVSSHAEHILTDSHYDTEQEEFLVSETPSIFKLGRPFFIGLLVLLVIPALNISGLIGARMDRMKADLGIRRSYGATRSRLMRMVLSENLVLTLAGGLIGLIVAWMIAVFAGDVLMQFMPLGYQGKSSYGENASIVTGEMAFAPMLFLLVLLICLTLNLLSAWIPARNAMHQQITESLNSKR